MSRIRRFLKSIARKACAVLLLFWLGACREQILHNLGENEANRFIARLSEIQVRAGKTRQADNKWSLEVPSGDVLKAIQYLTTERLMRDPATGLSENPSLLSSREDQRFRYERALSGGLEATLANLPGVLEARVHLNLPAIDPFFGQVTDKGRGSAGVLLLVSAERNWQENEIARLVSGASGIEVQNISVLISASRAVLNGRAQDLFLPSPGPRSTAAAAKEDLKHLPFPEPAQSGALTALSSTFEASLTKSPERLSTVQPAFFLLPLAAVLILGGLTLLAIHLRSGKRNL